MAYEPTSDTDWLTKPRDSEYLHRSRHGDNLATTSRLSSSTSTSLRTINNDHKYHYNALLLGACRLALNFLEMHIWKH